MMLRSLVLLAIAPTVAYGATSMLVAQVGGGGALAEYGPLGAVLVVVLGGMAALYHLSHKDAREEVAALRKQNADMAQRLREVEDQRVAAGTEMARAMDRNSTALEHVTTATLTVAEVLRGCPHHDDSQVDTNTRRLRKQARVTLEALED